MKKTIPLFLSLFAFMGADDFISVHDNQFLQDVLCKLDNNETSPILATMKSFTAKKDALEDQSGNVYYPEGWHQYKFYAPAGTNVSFYMGSIPNCTYKIHTKFIPDTADASLGTIDHKNVNTNKYITNTDYIDLSGQYTVENRMVNTYKYQFDTSDKSGWIYLSMVLDEVTWGEHQSNTCSSANISSSYTIFKKDEALFSEWLNNVKTVTKLGDPKAALSSMVIKDVAAPNVVSERTITLDANGVYDKDDNESQTCAKWSSSSSSSSSHSSTSSASSGSTSNSSSSGDLPSGPPNDGSSGSSSVPSTSSSSSGPNDGSSGSSSSSDDGLDATLESIEFSADRKSVVLTYSKDIKGTTQVADWTITTNIGDLNISNVFFGTDSNITKEFDNIITLSLNQAASNGSYIMKVIYSGDSLTDKVSTNTLPNETTDTKYAFIERLYQNILDRSFDQGGMETWIETIEQEDATKALDGFFYSDEFKNKDLNNSEYIETLYKTYFGRDSDPSGKEYWEEQLNSNVSRDAVRGGFTYSVEFSELADGYDIDVTSSDIDYFIKSSYKIIMGRNIADDDTFIAEQKQKFISYNSSWSEGYAKTLFNSSEYKDRNTTNSEFVFSCYMGLLGRGVDQATRDERSSKLASGAYSRDDMIKEIVTSAEFKTRLKTFGITK